MSEPQPVIEPYLSCYLFFSDRDGQEFARQWGERLAAHLGVPLHTDYEQIDASKHICYLYPLPDSWVLYLSVDLSGAQPLTAWQELSTTLFGAERQLWQALHLREIRQESPETPSKRFWGSSLFFGAKGSLESLDVQAMQPHLPLLLGWHPDTDKVKVKSSVQPWGQAWQLREVEDKALESNHLYVVLQERSLTAQASEFFQFGTLDQLELSLHKVYHHLKQHHLGRKKLYQLIPELDAQLKALLKLDAPTQAGLSALAKQYVEYVDWISQVAALQQTVTINSHNYNYITDELALLHERDEVYRHHVQLLKRGLAQLEADKVYYEAAMKRLDTGLQTLRAELELQLVSAEHKAAEEREQARILREKEREEERLEREREKEEAQQRREAEKEAREREKQESEEREKERDLLLAKIGLLLGVTQLWPIIQGLLHSKWGETTQLIADLIFLAIIALLVALMVEEWFEKRGERDG